MRITLRLCALLISLLAFQAEVNGQFNPYVSGYMINNDGQRTDGLIQVDRMDPRDNPGKFSYKATKESNAEEIDPNNIKEFGFMDGTVFRRHTMEMDRFPSDLDRIAIHIERWERNPTMKVETQFLRLLVEGKATLYAYDDNALHRYFISVADAPVKQLVNKKYYNKNQEIQVNEAFKQTLFNDLKCESITQKSIVNLKYEKKDLVKLINLYNACAGSATK